MDKLNWCIRQKNGIELVEPSINLREAYNAKAEEALELISETKKRSWQITAAYYAMYHGLYSLLAEIGVKCEIHSCTIEFAKKFLGKHFSEEELALVEIAFRARNNVQYYVDKKVTDENYALILENAAGFLAKCKNTAITLGEKEKIRNMLKGLKKTRQARYSWRRGWITTELLYFFKLLLCEF